MRFGWRLIAGLLACAVAVTTVSCQGRRSADRDPSPSAPAPTTTALSRADLEAAGLVVVADERAALPAGLAITAIQAERMVTEQAIGAGVRGRDLDALAPMPAGAPGISYLVAAWTVKGTSDAARTARSLLGERSWHGTADVVFPTAVVAMFVADLARLVASAPAGPAAPATRGPRQASGEPLAVHPAKLAAAGPCSTATEFLAGTIKGVFDALKLSVPATGGIFDSVIAALAAVWNYAVELARGVVQATVTALTKPVFDALRIAATGLGAASVLMSYLNGQKLIVTLDPQAVYRLAVGSEPDLHGRYVARARDLSKDWPPALIDCLAAADAHLPELLQPGATAKWQVHDSPDHPGLIVPGQLDTTVASDNRAYLDFVTGRESEERAKGPAAEDGPIVTVDVEQKAVTDFLRKTEAQLTGQLKSTVLGLIPEPDIRDALRGVINKVLDPVAERIRAEIEGRVGGVFTLSGQGLIRVVFHEEPQPSRSATPSKPTQGDFCGGLLDMVRWAAAHDGLDWVPYGTEIAARMTKLRPLAPEQLRGAVDIVIHVYRLLASGTSPVQVGIVIVNSGYVDATQQLIGYCKIPAAEFPGVPD